jgi:Domain of unknown function (DUF5671)
MTLRFEGAARVAQDSDKLIDFIRAARAQQVPDDSIVALLRQNGWSERRIYQALSSYYESVLGTPIPSRGTRIEAARDAFFYLLAFTTLGFWTVALILFADNFVDHAIPSALDQFPNAQYFRSAVAGQLATLIVAFPLFLFISRLIALEVARRPEAMESGVRKWLTYIALVVTAVTLLGDAVAFLSAFLSGDLTARFAWKAFALFVVAAGVFSYYLGAVRTEAPPAWRDRVYAWVATAGVALALALGFLATGAPAQMREYSLDERRITLLTEIAGSVERSWTNSTPHRLPRGLGELSGAPVLRDPETGRELEYRPLAGSKYQLCATFDTASEAQATRWQHPVGYHCFKLDATVSVPYYYVNSYRL